MCVQGLEAIGMDMEAADTQPNFGSHAPNWASAVLAVRTAVVEGQKFSRQQGAAHRPKSQSSSGTPSTDWEAALEQAVTSVLLWAQNASKTIGERNIAI